MSEDKGIARSDAEHKGIAESETGIANDASGIRLTIKVVKRVHSKKGRCILQRIRSSS